MSTVYTRTAAAGLLATAAMLVACAKDDRRTCTTVGREGGVLQSYDTVLTIAIQPEALDETENFCLSPTDAPPSIFGSAYLLDPPVRLNYDAVVSYRGALPDDLSDVNVGRISARDFASGDGRWVSLSGCRVDEDARHVQCIDTELSKFYGLLDRILGDTSDTVADTSGSTGDATTDGSVSMTTSMTDPTTDTDPQPIDYPPECDSLFRGPYDVVGQGTRFEPVDDQSDGPEDMAADGQGGFIARSGTRLFRLDVTGGTLGTPNDPGFVVEELVDSPLFGSATLGIRYAPSGDLVFAQGDDDVLRSMTPDGNVTTLVEGIDLPNGVYVDTDGDVWYTEFLGNRVWRVPSSGGTPTMIAMSPQPNGILYDPRRQMVFFPNFMSGEMWSVAIDDAGTPAAPVLVTTIEGGTVDGLAMDVCGNLYGVDNAGPVRLLRIFMDDFGVMSEVEEIAVGLGQQANASFGVGDAYGPFETAIFLTGLSGEIEYVDVQITGAAVPGLSAPPPTIGDDPETTGTDSGGSTGDATSTSGGT